MRKLAFVLFLSITVSYTYAANTMPADLIGEWTSDNAEFNNRDAIIKGVALYINADGTGAFIAAPPPIGSKAVTSYDAKKQVLTLILTENGKQMSTLTFNYDPKAKSLKSNKNEPSAAVFKRRQDRVPTYINEMMK